MEEAAAGKDVGCWRKEARANPRGLQGLPSGNAQLHDRDYSSDFLEGLKVLKIRFKSNARLFHLHLKSFVSFVGGEYDLSRRGGVDNPFPSTDFGKEKAGNGREGWGG